MPTHFLLILFHNDIIRTVGDRRTHLMNDQNMLNEGRKMKAAFQERFILRQPSMHGLLGRSLQIRDGYRNPVFNRSRG